MKKKKSKTHNEFNKNDESRTKYKETNTFLLLFNIIQSTTMEKKVQFCLEQASQCASVQVCEFI